MQCREAEGLLPPYADDALPPRERERVEAHLHACGECRRGLDLLQRSLAALSTASPGDSPDLWAQFQARRAGQVPCSEVAELLSDYVDGVLPASQHVTVATHLESCPECARQEEALTRSLQALDRSARSAMGTAPDLWAAFSSRLAEELSCSRVEELLPADLERAVEGTELTALRCHLEQCESCAASAGAYGEAAALLDRVGAAAPGVDLWPAFAERLAREQEAARSRSLGGLVDAVGAWLRRPLAAPSLVLAAGVVALLFLRTSPKPAVPAGGASDQLVKSFPLPNGGEKVAGLPDVTPYVPDVDRAEIPSAVQPLAHSRGTTRPIRMVSHRREGSRPRAQRERHDSRTLLVAARPRRAPSVEPFASVMRTQAAVAAPSIASQLNLALNPDLPQQPAPEVRATGASGMPTALTEDLTVLAVSFKRVSDAVNSPLGTGRDDEK